ncbi:MAG TPA: hypothetical protein VLH94_04515 [Spirochaetia bacterium]|nr:hypothetical protein [Spirochaetia bacterium]
MKNFLPGERIFPVSICLCNKNGDELTLYLLKNDLGFVRKRWWGGVQFIESHLLASRWGSVDDALTWGRNKGLA